MTAETIDFVLTMGAWAIAFGLVAWVLIDPRWGSKLPGEDDER